MFINRYQNISHRTKALQKIVGFFSFYYIHLSHACCESAKNFGNIKINYFLWCYVILILFLVPHVITTRCQGLDLVMGLTGKSLLKHRNIATCAQPTALVK